MTFIKEHAKFEPHPPMENINIIPPNKYIDIDDKYYKPHAKPTHHLQTGKLQPAHQTMNHTFNGFMAPVKPLNEPGFKNYGQYFYNQATGSDSMHS